MKTYIFIIISLVLVFASCGPEKEQLTSETTDAGVILHGFNSHGWIKNTNDFPVSITKVYQGRGDATESIKLFQPGEKKEDYISNSMYGYIIENMNGVGIGFIKPELNGKMD